MSSGNPTSAAAAVSAASSRPVPALPGTVGTPRAMTASFAAILSPMVWSASTPGPMNTTPAAAQARAKSAFSLRKP